MFSLTAAGLSAGVAASIVDAINGGMTIATALALFAGVAGGAAYFLENGIKALISWAGKATIVSW